MEKKFSKIFQNQRRKIDENLLSNLWINFISSHIIKFQNSKQMGMNNKIMIKTEI